MPDIPHPQELLLVNRTMVTIRLDSFADGGCPILYFVIEHRRDSQPQVWIAAATTTTTTNVLLIAVAAAEYVAIGDLALAIFSKIFFSLWFSILKLYLLS